MRNTSLSLVTLLSAAIAISSGPSPAFAEKAAPAAPAGPQKPAKPGEDKVDISDLETKYWAPKDTDFSVVQNRTYSKTHRFFVSTQYGVPINDPYSSGSTLGVSLNYFMSERYGLQLTGLKANMKNNQATNDLTNFGSGIQPDHGRLNNYVGVGFNYVPFYAKMSFMGQKIIYFDMAVTPTVGLTTYDQIVENSTPHKSAFTYGVDVTQYFFFSNWFALRADLKNQWYTQDIVRYHTYGGINTGGAVDSKKIHDTLFLMGATFYW